MSSLSVFSKLLQKGNKNHNGEVPLVDRWFNLLSGHFGLKKIRIRHWWHQYHYKVSSCGPIFYDGSNQAKISSMLTIDWANY